MSRYIYGYLLSYLYIFLLIAGIGFLQHKTKMAIETSRKLIHILLGFVWMFLYYFFWDNWQILIVPISFIIINWISYKTKLFNMIERDGGKNHKGTIYFAIAITVLMSSALIFPSTIIQTGIATFCLCFGDGFAALIGTRFKKPILIRKDKSLQGSLACVAGSVLGLIIFQMMTEHFFHPIILIILSIATALLELAGKGLDNFSIVAGIYLLSVLLV